MDGATPSADAADIAICSDPGVTQMYQLLVARACTSTCYICVTPGSAEIAISAASADGVAPSTSTAALRRCHHQSGTWTGLLMISARYPATSATIPPDIHHLQCVGDKVIVGTRTEGVHAIEDTRVNETCPGRTQCTCLSATGTRLELCGPGADVCRVIWHAVVIVGPDVDTRAHALASRPVSGGLRPSTAVRCRVMISELGRVPSDPCRSRTATPGPAPCF